LPALILGPLSQVGARSLQALLLAAYPPEHALRVCVGQDCIDLPITQLDSLPELPLTDMVFVPALQPGHSFEAFAETVAHLRAPGGCPWDREQTHESLRTHLLEEAYEVLAAIDGGDPSHLREELGDLLLQIVLHAQISSEEQSFSIGAVLKGIHDKIIRRHPHVFGDLKLGDTQAVLANWERLKEHERAGQVETKGLLDGVPLALPALSQAQEYQDRAARVGFDWPEIQGVVDKISEEVGEVQQAGNDDELASELGDLFFALVNFARWKRVDAESALRGANGRFARRFGHVEAGARSQGRALSDLSLEEMDALWNESKRGDGGRRAWESGS
jgi:tetrapyrrole methylase family protein/MazG family protein